MNDTLVYSHPDCLGHDPGAGHPESPRRLQSILDAIGSGENAPMGNDEQILLAHSPALLQQIKEKLPERGLAQIDADTLLSPGSLQAAYRATGAACQGIDVLMAGRARHVFCATRPPGHHASRERAMGFCLFNHIAIAALYAQQAHGLERIAIIDFDVHHGNGTQDIVSGKAGLLYLSTHQSPLYPGSGHEEENIPGNIINIPLPAGTGHSTYLRIFSDRLLPELEAFDPQLLLVSAGFDAHHADPLAGLSFTEVTYAWLGETLGQTAARHNDCPILSQLEGGYNVEVLGSSVSAYLEGIVRADHS